MVRSDFYADHKPQVETGADRKALLEALDDERRRSALLQAKVDSLVNEVSRLQCVVMEAGENKPPPSRTIGPRPGQVEKYRAVFPDEHALLSASEIASRLGVSSEAVYIWIGKHAQAAGIVPSGTRTGARGKPTKLYSRTTALPEAS
jgi:hypothetical protein